MKKLFLLCLSTLFFTTLSFGQTKPMIEFGAGGNSNGETLEVLVRAKFQITSQNDYDNSYYFIVKMESDGSIAEGQMKYIDFSLKLAGLGIHSDEDEMLKGWIEGSIGNLNINRNLQLDLDRSVSFSLLGLRGGGELEMNKNVKLFLEAGVDFLGLAFTSQRANDNAALYRGDLSSAEAAQWAIGLELFNKIRIEFGQNVHNMYGNGYEYYTGNVICESYTDEDWCYDSWNDEHYVCGYDTYTECYDEQATHYQESWKYKETYLQLVVKLNKRLKVFGKASYNVFQVREETGSISESTNGGWQLMFGILFNF